MRNKVIIFSLIAIAIVGGLIFYVGKSGSISADVESKDCKYYTFTDRKSYSQNQIVNLGVKNDKYSKCILKLRNDIGPWSVVDSGGNEVYKSESAEKNIVNLKPGERQNWQWSKISSSGSNLLPGKYKIKFTSLNKDAEFTILNR
jgi:hypothetical protein